MSLLRRLSDGVSRLLGGQSSASDLAAGRPDFLAEGMALEKVNDLDGALTSYRLALRASPESAQILLNMAIVFTKSGRADEAIRSYRKILDTAPTHPGANYGVAFLLAKRGETDAAIEHLETFLAATPSGGDSAKWMAHAQASLRTLRGEPVLESGGGADSETLIDTPLRNIAVAELSGEADAPAALKATGTDGQRRGNDG
jgi:tetratricopeptide (TPR) repeat protein